MRKRPRHIGYKSPDENLGTAIEKLGLVGRDFTVGDLTKKFRKETLRKTLTEPERKAVLQGFRLDETVANQPDVRLGRIIQRASRHIRGEAIKAGVVLNSLERDARYGRN